MTRPNLQKYVRDWLTMEENPHPEVTAPRLTLRGGQDGFGNRDFNVTWWIITEPFEMVSEHHSHDFDQFFMFVGGNLMNMTELGGEVELTLSEDGKDREKFSLRKPTMVWIPAGLYHGPLSFKVVDNPSYPIVFHDGFFAPGYGRKAEG